MGIRDYSSQELLQKLDSGKLSVLKTIGATDLKRVSADFVPPSSVLPA